MRHPHACLSRSTSLLGVLLALLLPSLSSAQQTGQDPPPTREERLRARQDSIAELMRERLLLLGRGPGADSATLAADSARLAGPPPRGAAPARGPGARDSISRALLEIPGYTSTYYVGTEAIFNRGTGELILLGDSITEASALQSGQEIRASEQLIYDANGNFIRTAGVATLTPTVGAPTTSEGLTVDLESEIASALGARTVIQQNAEWYVRGDLPIVHTDGGFGHDLNFTTCELDNPHYHFRADEVKWLRSADSVLVARNVRFYIADVPIFWLPFIAQSTRGGRRSGLLTPVFSVNDIVRNDGNQERRISNVGYYWAMNDFMDSSAALDFFSGNFTSLTGAFRYSWRQKFLRGSMNARRFWRDNGSREIALATQHDWQFSERTSFRASGRFVSSTIFVTNNSFDPAEVVGSVDSEGGVNHRFDWGTLSVSGSRRQFLNDDRVETSFPDANLSVRSLTLFPASPGQAQWYSNMALGGSVRLSARSTNRNQDPDMHIPGQEDVDRVNGAVSTSLTLGALSISPGFDFEKRTLSGLPFDSLPFFPGGSPGEFVDFERTLVNWQVGAGYQQRLIGSTTLTPRVSLAGSLLRSDTIPEAQSFVSSPTRLTVGADLRSDLYAFIPGIGGFEQIRHKLSPSISWSYAPSVTPNALQMRVFGAQTTQERNVISLGLNQTFEARRRLETSPGDSLAGGRGAARATANELGTGETLQRLQRGEIVSLLNLRTSAIQYDLVRADSLGRFIDGFTTTSVTNTASSDLLPGLSVTMQHDLFDEDDEGERFFSPKLTRLNFNFRIDNETPILGFLGFLNRVEESSREEDSREEEEEEEDDRFEEEEEDDFFAADELDFAGGQESAVVPRAGEVAGGRASRGRGGPVGAWSADLRYALTRSRSGIGGSQNIQARIRLKPTELWDMTWNTGYDVDEARFNDHRIELTRDLHRWEANFGFVQTATGNWSFRFEIRLNDQRDLKFDYEQRSVLDNRFE